jgi:tetratricopeptide (TPR) repeat protein
MLELKRISAQAIPEALKKALRYRLLNEPAEAVSICRDILSVNPDDQETAITLLLALTDQFDTKFANALDEAKVVLRQIRGDYEQAYYKGVINERWGKAQLARNIPEDSAIGWFREAMRCYEAAEKTSRPNDPDALLRWNTCARFVNRFAQTKPSQSSLAYDVHESFGDDVPPR